MKSTYIRYTSPNTGLSSITNLINKSNSTEKLIYFFKEYTGKKFILPAFSCRSALYLAYASLGKTGDIITSPLTCLTAITPVIHSGNRPVFIDIDPETLNLNTELIENYINNDTIAIQVIHFAGYPCDMDKIRRVAEKKNLIVIEDCAQSFGAKYKGRNTGSFGEIACFSLGKNLYGVAGGILATDIEQIYLKAKKIQDGFEKYSLSFLSYRFLRNYFKSQSHRRFFRYLHKKLIDIKEFTRSEVKPENEDTNVLKNYLKRPDKRIFNFSWHQIKSLNRLHRRRIEKALIYMEKIKNYNSFITPLSRDEIERSFVKFYIYGNFNSEKDIKDLNDLGIEAKHLEEEYGINYQSRLDKNPLFKNNSTIRNCTNYLRIHDSLISLPLYEDMTENEIDYVLSTLNRFKKR